MGPSGAPLRASSTILELLHPLGHAGSVRVFGSDCRPDFNLCPSEPGEATGMADLVILAPSLEELSRPGWLAAAVGEAAEAVRPDGLLYVVAHQQMRGALAALLAEHGLVITETVLHHPDWATAQTLIPLRRPTLAYAFTRLIRTQPLRRNLALALLGVPGALPLFRRLLPTTGLLVQRPGSPAPAAWFTRAVGGPSGLPGRAHLIPGRNVADRPRVNGVVLNSSWRGPEGAVLLHAVGEGPGEPLAVAKTCAGSNCEGAIAREADGLAQIAAAAGGFGVRVPALLQRGHLAQRPYLVESAVTGERASVWLQNHPDRLDELLTALTHWLGAWKSAAARPQVAARPMLDAYLLQPAAELMPDLGHEGYRSLADRIEGREVRLAPMHGDLTMVNVLVGRGMNLGVIDWETTTAHSLPLADFFYAVVDAVAALEDYRDRPGAYTQCFTPGGKYQGLVAQLQGRIVEQLGLTPDEVALSFHASWLSFAVAERRETAKAMPDEFLQIARMAAAGARPPDPAGRVTRPALRPPTPTRGFEVNDSPSQDGRRRLLLLSPFAPRLDAAMGGPRVIAQMIMALAERERIALLYLRAAEEAPLDERVKAACEIAVETVREPIGRWTLQKRIGAGVRGLRGVPGWVHEWSSPTFALTLDSLIAGWQPDVVQAEFHVMGQYLPRVGRDGPPTILTEHEPGAAAAADRRRAGLMAGRILPTVEVRAWGLYERWLVQQPDAIVTFTERDRRAMRDLGARSRVEVITPGASVPAEPSNPEGEPPPTVLFFGNYVHAPNVDAALRLACDIYPRLREEIPDLRLVLPGDRAPRQLRAIAGEQIEVPGRVPDLGPYLDAAAVVVAPLRLGGGMRVKVLEAISAGKAIVASSLALEGLDLVEGQQVICAETDDDFVAQVLRLLRNPEERVALAGRARAWAMTHLSWERSAAHYEALHEELIRQHAETGVRRLL